jgi:hypothetical protein
MADVKGESWLAHKYLFLACGVMILSPFQYGIDFGMIGGRFCSTYAHFGQNAHSIRSTSNGRISQGLRLPIKQNNHWMEYHN